MTDDELVQLGATLRYTPLDRATATLLIAEVQTLRAERRLLLNAIPGCDPAKHDAGLKALQWIQQARALLNHAIAAPVPGTQEAPMLSEATIEEWLDPDKQENLLLLALASRVVLLTQELTRERAHSAQWREERDRCQAQLAQYTVSVTAADRARARIPAPPLSPGDAQPGQEDA